MATTSVSKESSVRRRLFAALREADERYRNELMDEEERLLLRERILRLKMKLARTAS